MINICILVGEYWQLFVRIILSKANKVNVGIQDIVVC